jgi:hypothetical protein
MPWYCTTLNGIVDLWVSQYRSTLIGFWGPLRLSDNGLPLTAVAAVSTAVQTQIFSATPNQPARCLTSAGHYAKISRRL